MKIIKAIIRDKIKEVPTALLTAEKGHDMTFEAGLLHLRCGSTLYLIPASNIIHMHAEEAPKKK